jgi:hypothetical protein
MGKKRDSRPLNYVFFKYHCDISEGTLNSTKKLDLLWDNFKIEGYEKSNTVILDDYDEVQKSQDENCLIAKPFQFKDPNSDKDDFLPYLQASLEEAIKKHDDINSMVKEINKKTVEMYKL